MKKSTEQQFPNTPLGDGGKQLLLIRHAKSSWDDFSIKDFDRPLNGRGKKDAPVMAKRLLDKDITIERKRFYKYSEAKEWLVQKIKSEV